MSHVTTFREYLEKQFGISLPKDAAINEQEGVIRIYSKSLMMLKPAGYMGFVAGKVSTKGIEVKSEFAQLFGKSASKNLVSLNEKQAKDFVESDCVEALEPGEGPRIAKFGRHVLGVGKLRGGRLYPDFIGKGRKRVENSLMP
jgi:NOL1/NOP2/fmu family ribosome biogenesis protein